MRNVLKFVCIKLVRKFVFIVLGNKYYIIIIKWVILSIEVCS